MIQENFDIGVARMQLGLLVKFSCWTVLPWSLCALARPSFASGDRHDLFAAIRVRKQWQLRDHKEAPTLKRTFVVCMASH